MSFEPFVRVEGTAAPLPQANIDTDVIIRVDHLLKARSELGPFAFESLRFLTDGTENPNFVLNDPKFRGSPILVTGSNFGCGSSREPAVWALVGLGVRCLIGTTFGDIFLANCAQNGVLVVCLAPIDFAEIEAATRNGERVSVDLPSQTISVGNGSTWTFGVLLAAKESLMQGLDDIELAVADATLIGQWQEQDRIDRPWIWDLPPGA